MCIRDSFGTGNPEAGLAFARVASAAHWAPATLPDDLGNPIRETALWTAPELSAPSETDGINSSLCHAFIFDFCGVELDPVTAEARIDRYVTMHDCGTILHEGMVEGQIRGAFAHAVGAALYEEYAYDEDGAFVAWPRTRHLRHLSLIHI